MEIRAAMLFVALACCIGLLGCGAAHSLDPDTAIDKQNAKTSSAALAAIDDAKCQGYGFQPGSAAYEKCRKDYDSHRVISGQE